MKITGQILKENREKRGITINEVALATKISSKALIAIEEGDVDRLPPKTFLRGFVLAYATYLKLNTETILSTFYEEMGSTKPKPQLDDPETSTSPGEATRPSASPSASPKKSQVKMDGEGIQIGTPSSKIFLVTGVALLVIAIVVIKKKMDSYSQEAQRALEVAKNTVPAVATPEPSVQASPTPVPTSEQVAPAKLSTSETAVSNSTDAGNTPGSEKTSSVVPPSAGAVAPSNTKAPTVPVHATPAPDTAATNSNVASAPTPTIAAKPTLTSTPAPAKPVVTATPVTTVTSSGPAAPAKPVATAPTPVPTPAPAAKPTPTAKTSGKTQELIIEALNNVEVEAILEGETPKKFTLKAEQVHTIKAKGKVILKLNDGGAVNITNNGIDRGVPGDLGKATKVEYP